MRLAVTGATGRMGRNVVRGALDRGDEVAVAVNRGSPDATVEGVAVEPASDLPELLDDRRPDALVDFTGPESSVRYVEAAAAAGVPAVVGTTGFDDEEAAAIRAAGERVPVLRAANFARGVSALARALEAAVAALPGYDVELTDTHHDGKVDAPSGTAKELIDRVEDARSHESDGGDAENDRGENQRVHGREGEAPRRPGEVGVHSRRAGDVTGEHEVLLAGNHEVVTLTHRAEDRGVYAAGALDAAEWLQDRPAGNYDFGDVVA